MGVHGCGVGDADSADDESVEVPPSERKSMFIMPGRAWEDMYSLLLCVSVVVHVRSCSAGEACVIIVDIVHTRVLRSLHWPRSLIIWRVESPGVADEGRGANVLLSGNTCVFIASDGGALRDSRGAGPMCMGGCLLLRGSPLSAAGFRSSVLGDV